MNAVEISQEQLEAELLRLLLEGDLPILRDQVARARVVRREFSGVGFFTSFEVQGNIPLAEPPNFAGGNVNIQMEDLVYGAGCVLFVRNGKLDMLECYTNGDEHWPEHIRFKSLSDALPVLPR